MKKIDGILEKKRHYSRSIKRPISMRMYKYKDIKNRQKSQRQDIENNKDRSRYIIN